MGVSDEQLLQQARDVMKNAYCPYSKFPVGAALLTNDDTIVLGVNCENASYGATICAERSAMTAALTKGYRKFKAIAISTEMEEPASPCGMCRQFLIEFGEFKVILGSSRSNSVITSSTASLLPLAFTPVSLDEHSKQATKA